VAEVFDVTAVTKILMRVLWYMEIRDVTAVAEILGVTAVA
jgi:hypothetical protein